MQFAFVALLCLHLAAAQNPCPDGSVPVNCLVNPCDRATCPNNPNATCRPNYCGTCGADFFLSGNNITANCTRIIIDTCAAVLCAAVATCPDGSTPATPEGECCPRCPPERCSLRPQVGDCDAVLPRFFYNSTARVCQRFNYGGCGGNENRFTDARACLETCNPRSVCNQRIYPRDTAIICDVITRRWTYNATAGQCMVFNYSPCGQDRVGYNVFDSEMECSNSCVAPPDPCTLPPAPGPCEAYGPSFFYNSTARVCQRFIYGGCQGNDNRFPTARRCLERCNPLSACNERIYPPNFNASTCGGVVRRLWTFDAPAGQCESFPYLDCGQTRAGYDVFSTQLECINICLTRPTCNQPIYPPDFNATCGVVRLQWTFNATAGQCESFPYRECGQTREGYDVFSTQVECIDTCLTPLTCRGSDGRHYQVGDTFRAADGCNTCTCTAGGRAICTLRACPECPDGSPIVSCFADPCSVNSCPNYPNARCQANYCGGCNAVFYDSAGNDITAKCSAVLPIPIRAEVCPAVEPSAVGACSELCSNDLDCNNTTKCCSNGCGRSCVVPDRIPYYSIPQQCPSTSDRVGICTITPNNCQSDKNCSDAQLCCQSGCGRVCTNRVSSPQPCYAIAAQFNRTRASDSGGLLGGTTVVGAYIPQCALDGSFQPIQCHGSIGYCWCVHTQTGQPLSPFTRRSSTQCDSCSYNGNTYYPGQQFPSSDGCNLCSCSQSGHVACTERACIDTCRLPSDSGPCRGAFQAYYYDFQRDSCRSFVYGGCQGNNNKFKSIRDCLRRCDANNSCLLPPETGPCRAAIPSFFFNATSGVCERFTYGGCGGNGNRFSTAAECQRTCDPSRPIDRCEDTLCPALDCPADRQVRDPEGCCATCVPRGCADDEFLCSNGDCISDNYVCDGLRDCRDGRDEADCPRSCDFMCGDGVCIPERYVCDGYLDCRDGSDVSGCTTDFANTYYPDVIPRQCPSASDLIGVCAENCSSNRDCRGGNLCCSNGCGHTCLPGDPVTPLCSAIARQVNTSLLGAFVPSCERDGSFSQMQCHPSTGFCWCVDTATGRPQSEGVRGGTNCGGCTGHNGITYPYGERYVAEDGCNICYCSGEFGALCTRRNCVPGPCRLGTRSIAHNATYSDDCSLCRCQFRQLSCQRRPCAITAPRRRPKRVTMTFSGSFSNVASSADRQEQLKREVIRTFLTMYGASFGLMQEQIGNVQVQEGSVIVIVTLSDSQNSSTGANVTILIGQLQEDFDSGSFVVRVNNEVLEPSGQLLVEDETAGGETAFPWWGILLVCVGGIALIIIVLVLVSAAVVHAKRNNVNRSDGYHSDSAKYPEMNDYETPVAYKKVQDDVDFKEAL